ncbi:hypothetical protein DTO027B5_7155 [Paecilomyces variotii]|nr:hypothetical protein DTO169C6_7526 [Paecilomyces variotii]KAJ9230525.1 hypothetical protein DTO169E5_8364 [Paecilomyces variotii]KAJ9246589.1 hypothetical protein DTO207G8_8783 [Paecilomyces variotii]KAJ9259740.1 hypothetical protein DTO195F2_4861 [Paecilomyces variotii]KAJ9306572.1 hypothetical protein DTO217A2_3924 [Paecilomyces variotii]
MKRRVAEGCNNNEYLVNNFLQLSVSRLRGEQRSPVGPEQVEGAVESTALASGERTTSILAVRPWIPTHDERFFVAHAAGVRLWVPTTVDCPTKLVLWPVLQSI